MNRVWTALLLLATIVVAGSVGYVLVHNDKVAEAGKTPGYSAPAPPTGGNTGKPSGSPGTGSGSGKGSASASTSGTAASTRITFLGDNWTKGAGVNHDPAKGFPALVAGSLGVKYAQFASDGAGYAKKGQDGKTYGDLVGKVVSSKPQIVVVSGGRNDESDDVNTLDSAAKNLFADLKSKLPNAKIVAVAPFWGDSDHPSDLGKVDDAVKSGVQDAGGTYLDIPDPLHNHSDWMADAANPNAQGNQAIAAALKPQLQKLL